MQSVKQIVDKPGGLDGLLEKARQDEAKKLLPGSLFDFGPITAPDEQENRDRKPRRRKSEAA